MKKLRTIFGSLMVTFFGGEAFAESRIDSQMQPLFSSSGSNQNFYDRSNRRINYEGRVFVFDPKSLRWHAYSNGRLIRSGHAVGGANYCRDVGRACRTPVGHFRVHARRGANCVSNKYPLNRNKPRARMPYCHFFHRGFAIHGSYELPNRNASHGCIRVHPSAARWLHHNFLFNGTKVIVRPYR